VFACKSCLEFRLRPVQKSLDRSSAELIDEVLKVRVEGGNVTANQVNYMRSTISKVTQQRMAEIEAELEESGTSIQEMEAKRKERMATEAEDDLFNRVDPRPEVAETSLEDIQSILRSGR
jgi:hypothetical protein